MKLLGKSAARDLRSVLEVLAASNVGLQASSLSSSGVEPRSKADAKDTI